MMYLDDLQSVRTYFRQKKESKKLFELAVNSWKTRCKLTPKIGKGKYVLAESIKIMKN
jgi:hypothetical protein